VAFAKHQQSDGNVGQHFLPSHTIAITSYYSNSNLFSKACCDRTRSNGFELREGRFRLDLRKKFFTMRMEKPCNGLPREVVDAPSLGTFQTRLDGALSNLIQCKMSLLMVGGLDYMAFRSPFQPKPSDDSIL